MARVGPLKHDHARILTQPPGQLAVADIDRVDLCRPAVEKDIGEAAGGCPDVQADTTGRVDFESVQPFHQLESAARDPGVILAAHLERLVGPHGLTRLVDPDLAGEHDAGHDQRLRAAPAFRQAAIDQGLIGALFIGVVHPCRSPPGDCGGPRSVRRAPA